MEKEEVTGQIIEAAMKVHSALGPGLLESAYEACLLFELHDRGLKAQKQVAVPIVYLSVKLDVGYRIDILVEDSIVLEIKAVEKLPPLHSTQLLSYLRLSGHKIGLLLNFNVTHMRDGINRVMNKKTSVTSVSSVFNLFSACFPTYAKKSSKPTSSSNPKASSK